jgi:ketosteroid isomerase-like protein
MASVIVRVMSERPAAIVKRFVDAINQAAEEGAGVEALVARVVHLLDPEVEYVNPPDALEPGARRGIEGMAMVARNLREAGVHRWEVERLVERGDRVACVLRLHIAGPASGLRMVGPWASALFTVRGDRIVRMEASFDPEEALERLGLDPNA